MEFALIERIRDRCTGARADVVLGIGDDAALLRVPAAHELAVTTDTLVAGVHFPHGADAADIGWKALAVNLSDLAAMGAMPAWVLLALTLPQADAAFVDGFASGFAELMQLHGVALVGGDTTGGPLAIGVTAHGLVPTGCALRRDGAQVGDAVFVTGTLGDAAAGLRWLDEARARRDGVDPSSRAALLQRMRRPTPRVAAGIALRGIASACIDVSDGLVADLGHVARRSAVGIRLHAAQLPASPALRAACAGELRIALQAAGGDDYELAFSAPPAHEDFILRELAALGCGATRIGSVVAGSGVQLVDAADRPVALAQPGWEHFA
ncbi:MAG: thiamine-phosphate kinase [Dokdonella sp.]|uniref:thiamine-phosphate kinase n=1 Tax=Dokdonella sp. TaxID=2291710 RepID=UPI0025BD0FED|nr:thiamine-phosphate kinase [Dokdonella sp.]MBX3701121.1 thiamine-phosphate kinase [Dokdonella sp.]